MGRITEEDIKKHHGNDITFLFKGSGPFTSDNNGNPLGVLIEKDGKIKCYECGQWYNSIGAHVIVHGLTARQYKVKYGFNITSGLVSKKSSHKYHKSAMSKNHVNPIPNEKRHSVKNSYRSIQSKNSSGIIGTCPEQMKRRYELVCAKLGSNSSSVKIKNLDSYLYAWILKEYGSINNARKELGSSFPKKKGEADLIYDIRNYVDNYGINPFNKKIKFEHSIRRYIDTFGSVSRALLHCGVVKEKLIRNGKINSYYIYKTI
jgi:hypothetical protein